MSAGAPDPPPHRAAEDEGARFRRVLSHFPTGVVVVTGASPAGPTGLAIGSFASVSLAPRMVGFFVDRGSTSWPALREAAAFCVNLLAADQEDVCRGFARSGGDKFAGVAWRPGATGAPVLAGVLAWIDCRLEREVEAGDHWFVLGRVVALAVERDERPLVFHRGALQPLDVR